jgi:hypothetical protein
MLPGIGPDDLYISLSSKVLNSFRQHSERFCSGIRVRQMAGVVWEVLSALV